MNKRTILVGAVSALVLMLGVACSGGDDEPSASSTPEATATAASAASGATGGTGATGATGGTGATGATGAPTPAATVAAATVTDEFKEFAPQIAEAVANQDLTFFAQHAWTEQVTCTEDHVKIEGFFAACENVGDQFQGVGLSVWSVQGGGLVPAERGLALVESLWTGSVEGEDDFGTGEAKLVALGANPRLGYEAQLAVITALIPRPTGMAGTGPLRAVVVTHWRFEDNDWRMFEVMQAADKSEDLLEPTAAGRAYLQDWQAFE